MRAGMVDFQYTPDMNDPVAKLKIAMTNMDGECKSVAPLRGTERRL
jgi:hypothetical protein